MREGMPVVVRSPRASMIQVARACASGSVGLLSVALAMRPVGVDDHDDDDRDECSDDDGDNDGDDDDGGNDGRDRNSDGGDDDGEERGDGAAAAAAAGLVRRRMACRYRAGMAGVFLPRSAVPCLCASPSVPGRPCDDGGRDPRSR